MFIVEATGLGADPKDSKLFVTFFGTPYMSAVLNLCMCMTFILGYFVTLVLQRWRAPRAHPERVHAPPCANPPLRIPRRAAPRPPATRWATRSEYGAARTNSIELAYLVCTNLRDSTRLDPADEMRQARSRLAPPAPP